MSYTLFNVPIYNERKAIRSLKRKGYTKITVVARQNFTLTITGRREVQYMMDYRDFYCIADYANVHWKGGFAPIEIAENAYNYLRDFEWSKENGKVANSIKVLLANLDEDIANGEQLEDVHYWTSEIRKELGLNEPIIQSLNGMQKMCIVMVYA